ncbi:hypothetical protein CHI12_09490 [Terribacillus saccharophilus]|uniref:Peptidoglycan binding-like domain-containing protein n=1 Tax=Terribacillus saccharophilus TaxID=361277 RepID=A0A268HD86_9BACI|nr:peptidoglycan-binding domain-containing protein [Terribacillus saccharophilus]PAE07790.1 hypothetical protein CHI12_09490 [Terribacillus saccharophilus]
MQEKLLQAGYKLPKYGADGGYGDETVAAVKAMQKANKIGVDDLYGSESAKSLDAEIAKEAKKDAPKKASGENKAVVPYPGKLIKMGSKGKDVQRIHVP